MNHWNICAALEAMGGSGTEEELILKLALDRNIQSNDLHQLRTEVGQTMEECCTLGCIERVGMTYKLTTQMERENQEKNSQLPSVAPQEQANSPLTIGSEEVPVKHPNSPKSRCSLHKNVCLVSPVIRKTSSIRMAAIPYQ